MTGNSYVMDWEAIDDFIDESELFTAYPHRYDPDDDEFHPHRPAAAHLCDASACTPRVMNTEFLPLSEFNEHLQVDDVEADRDYLPELRFVESDFYNLEHVNNCIAGHYIFDQPHIHNVVVVGYYMGVVEFVRV